MSEYWVSGKKYWCKHCSMFVKDSPLSKKDHDASPKHQYALKRVIRDLHRSKEKEAIAAENAKREADRLNNLDNPDYVPKALAKRAADLPPSGSSSSSNSKPSTFISEAQKKEHMDQLAALGVAMPESYRKEHAMIGDWETVAIIERPLTPAGGENGVGEDGEDKDRIKRRRMEEPKDDGEDEEAVAEVRRFTMRTMEYPGDNAAVGGVEDVVFKKKKSKQKVEPKVEESTNSTSTKEKGVWAPADLNEATTSASIVRDENVKEEEQQAVKEEEPADDTQAVLAATEDGVAFKSRKSRNQRRRL